MVTTTRYSVIFQKFPSRVRVAQKILSSIRVAGTRKGLIRSQKILFVATKGLIVLTTLFCSQPTAVAANLCQISSLLSAQMFLELCEDDHLYW